MTRGRRHGNESGAAARLLACVRTLRTPTHHPARRYSYHRLLLVLAAIALLWMCRPVAVHP